MARHERPLIKLGLLASTITALTLGCVLDLDKLDAGQDDSDDSGGDPSDTLECLIGTEIDSTGVEQSSWAPPCEVVCAEGWGHDGDALPIAWTTDVEAYPPDQLHSARALGLLDNGRVVVAIQRPGALGLLHFEPDGTNIGGFDVEGIDSTVYGVEIDSHVAYVSHGDEDGTLHLSAISIDNQQMLWTTDFAGYWATAADRSGGRIALSLTLDMEGNHEVVVLDLDGDVQWQAPTVHKAQAVALSPSGARVAVGGESTRAYDAADGALLDEFVHGELSVLWPQKATFLDEDRLVTVGGGMGVEKLTAWLSGNSLAGDLDWEHAYDRASSWCPDEEDDQYSAETAEWLSEVTELADGSVLIVGSESYEGGGVFGAHPWVARISASGEFLERDRGLWDGYAVDTAASPDGSVYVLIVDNIPAADGQGFAVRKYVP